MHTQYKSPNYAQRPQLSYNPPSHAYKPANQKKASSPSIQNPSSQTSSSYKPKHNNVSNGSVEPQGRELLVMTIDLGNGSKDLLRVFEGEDPYDLARSFCEKHGLDAKLVDPLAQNIYGNMEQVLQESVDTLNMAGPNSQRGTFAKDSEAGEDHQGTGKFGNQEYSKDNSLNQRFATQGARRDEDVRREEFSSRRYQTEDQAAPESPNSPQGYADEEGMYEMLDRGVETEAPLIAERVGMIGGKNIESPNKSSPQYQGIRNSAGSKGSPGKEERPLHSAYVGKQLNPRGHYNQNGAIASEPVDEFYNEEDDNQYNNGEDQTGNYELSFVPHGTKNVQGNRAQTSQGKSKPSNVQTSGLKQDHSLNKSSSSTLHNYSQEINYGTLLYHRGLQKNEEAKRAIQEKRKEKLELSQKECTFKPELNHLSQQIASTKARMDSLPEMLIQSGKNVKDKLERARSTQLMKDMDECTFKPEINYISHKIDQQKSQMTINADQDRCLRLYQTAETRKYQKDAVSNTLPSEYTFKPKTNNYKEGSASQMSFEERDRKFKDRLERVNYMRQLKQEAEVRDPETGEELFKPKTGRAPAGRNPANLPIGEHLYNQHSKMTENKKRLEYHQKSIESSMMARTNDKSQAIVESLMKRRLDDIFRRLDSDGDGLISSAKIDITQVEIDVLETLAPVLCEMEEKNQILDFETFYEQTERLLKLLSVAEKDQLLLGKKGPIAEPQYSFQPQIDKKSERLAQKKHPYGDINSLYASYTNERKKTENKIQEEKERKTQEELKECTFKPKLYAKGTSGTRSVKNASSGYNYFMDDLLL